MDNISTYFYFERFFKGDYFFCCVPVFVKLRFVNQGIRRKGKCFFKFVYQVMEFFFKTEIPEEHGTGIIGREMQGG